MRESKDEDGGLQGAQRPRGRREVCVSSRRRRRCLFPLKTDLKGAREG